MNKILILMIFFIMTFSSSFSHPEKNTNVILTIKTEDYQAHKGKMDSIITLNKGNIESLNTEEIKISFLKLNPQVEELLKLKKNENMFWVVGAALLLLAIVFFCVAPIIKLLFP